MARRSSHWLHLTWLVASMTLLPKCGGDDSAVSVNNAPGTDAAVDHAGADGGGSLDAHGEADASAAESGGDATLDSADAAAADAGADSSDTGADAGDGGEAGPPPCLEASAFAELFTIKDSSFCAIATYDLDESLGTRQPTWGKHGGPLTMRPALSGGGVTLERWSVSAQPASKLVKQDTPVATATPDGAYTGAQTLDLPFFGWTAISWLGAFPNTQGEFVMIKDDTVDRRFALNAPYAAAATGNATGGRLLYLASSAIGDPMSNAIALYAADACNTPMVDLGAGTGCSLPTKVAAWGDAPAALAVDSAGNAFAINSSVNGTQAARGFTAASVARGAAATDGTPLFTVAGFGSSVAAVAPSGGAPGVLVFQPFDPTSSTALDIIEQAYTAGNGMAAQGTPTAFLQLTTVGTVLFFMTDNQDRLWVASSPTAMGAKTKFVVLARR